MTSGCEHNKAKVRLFVEMVLNEGRLELVGEFVGDDYVGHLPDAEEGVFGPQGLRSLVASRRDACPNLHVKILDQVAEEDRVATRWRATSGLKAPGARVRTFEGISIVRLLAGKQVDSYTEYAIRADDAQAKRSPAQTSTGNRLAGGASGQTQLGS